MQTASRSTPRSRASAPRVAERSAMPQSAALTQARIAGPIGGIVAVFAGDTLVGLDFAGDDEGRDGEARLARLLARGFGRIDLDPRHGLSRATHAAAQALHDALARYFAGELDALDSVAVRTAGTAFQERVWAALRRIAPGRTASYAGLAARIGAPTAVRACGLANGMNPVSIVIPCHRVIGAGGALTGYAGGIARKRWLLEHEGALRAAS